ncbi:hypothetical protein ES319_D13G225900v1 [Gossypium barbadense]|uniref:Reverse transcriptase domain-containing protein n=2 Tax=Gossypium TaxID=3633 RepID=A0A5J5NUB3_GOSBA|nr:hypothetical protein ES319_D13G225900v1 [Gossypium barbadense]TYG38628.1 hypothetical protein ES288_D13G238800v1 [Gossypium darwinii]
MDYKVGRLPVRYLYVPLVSRKLSQFDFAALTNRILDRIQGWSTKHLSYVGRLQLIKVVIFSVQAYWSRKFLMPKSVFKRFINIGLASFGKGRLARVKGLVFVRRQFVYLNLKGAWD